MILLEYQNTKKILQKVTVQIGLKFLRLKKLKILFRGHVVNDPNGEEIAGTFYEKELQKKKNQKRFTIKRIIKRRGNKLHVTLKGYNNLFYSWIDKKDIV